MWVLVHLLSKCHFFFVIGFSVYGALATACCNEFIGPVIAGLMGFALWGPMELISEPSAHDDPIWELMKLNSWLFWPNLILFGLSGARANQDRE